MIKIYHEKIERITLIGEIPGEVDEAHAYCKDGGYTIRCSSPIRTCERETDKTQFRVIAEREVIE
jgi:hypothetical protein